MSTTEMQEATARFAAVWGRGTDWSVVSHHHGVFEWVLAVTWVGCAAAPVGVSPPSRGN